MTHLNLTRRKRQINSWFCVVSKASAPPRFISASLCIRSKNFQSCIFSRSCHSRALLRDHGRPYQHRT